MREAEIEQRLATQDKNFSYDVLRKVGSGSFGEVFLVRQKHSSRLFAMKRIDKRRIIDNNLEAYLRA